MPRNTSLIRSFHNVYSYASTGHCKTNCLALHNLSYFKAQFQPKISFTMMSSDITADHLLRTSNNSRDDGIHPMIVRAVSALSPTVKEIVLASEKLPAPFTFKAGQWVDVFIPNVKTVGGFSMCSSPHEMTTLGQLRLAIKYSTHPPALWMHEKCDVGEKLNVRVGGDFYLRKPDQGTVKTILLIAGGIGINPLSSMIHYAMNEQEFFQPGTRMCLLYSAKTVNEIIFKEAFRGYSNLNPIFTVKYFVTKTDQKPDISTPTSDESFQNGRIGYVDLENAIAWLTEPQSTPEYNNVEAFICGPPSMISDTTDALNLLKITSIHFEKWW